MPVALLAAASIVALAVSQWAVFVYAPTEATLGLSQKIFYTHLPMAWWGMVSFFVVFVASILYLLRRRPWYDLLAGTAAEVGVVFTGMALVSGSIWGRAAWNVWWTWDPRLTTTLIMWFIFAAYVSLRSAPMGPDRRAMLCAVLGIVGFLDVPLVFYSARLWRSIHPAVIGRQGAGMEPEMWHAMFVSLGAFGLLWLAVLLIRLRLMDAERRVETLLTGRETADLNAGE